MRTNLLVIVSVLAAVAALSSHRSVKADPPPLYPFSGYAYQPAQPREGAPLGAIVAFASTVGASHVERIAFVPVDALDCDDTDYRSLNVYDVDEFGDIASAWPLASAETTCTGTGSWTAGRAAVSATLSYELPAGHTLSAIWEPIGLGAATPAGAWRIE